MSWSLYTTKTNTKERRGQKIRNKIGYSLTDYDFSFFYTLYPHRSAKFGEKEAGIYVLKCKLKTMKRIAEFGHVLVNYSEAVKKNKPNYSHVLPWPDFCRNWESLSAGVK